MDCKEVHLPSAGGHSILHLHQARVRQEWRTAVVGTHHSMKSDTEFGKPNNSFDDSHRDDEHDPRRLYKPPQLIELGDVRDVTLGGSPGGGDSGPPGPFLPA